MKPFIMLVFVFLSLSQTASAGWIGYSSTIYRQHTVCHYTGRVVATAEAIYGSIRVNIRRNIDFDGGQGVDDKI